MTTEEKKVGRPSLLTEELIQRALFYLAENGWKEADDIVPSVAGLAFRLNTSTHRVCEATKENEEFAYLINCLQTVQARELINGGLLGAFNAEIAKFVLEQNFGK